MTCFSKEEYINRVRKTKEKMAEKGMGLLVVSNPANINYLTGYDGWSFYVYQCVVVAMDYEEPIWIGREMDANGARITTYLSEENILNYTDDYVQSLNKHPMHFVADVIKEKKWDKGSIGLEMDQFYFPHRAYVELERTLPLSKFVDANALVNWVRFIKSDAEVEFMKRAGKIATKVMDTARKSIDIGVRECDAAAAIVAAQYAGTKEFSGDYPAGVPMMMTGEAIKAPHLTWSEKVYKENDTVLLELSGCYRRYHAPIARTIFLGKEPPPLLEETAKVVLEGLNAVRNFIKSGVTAEEVEKVWRQAIEHSSVVKEARIGYSIGANYPPDWGEHTISLRPGDKTVLQPNAMLHIIPGIWHEKMGFEVSTALRVTENGFEELYDYPLELFIKG